MNPTFHRIALILFIIVRQWSCKLHKPQSNLQTDIQCTRTCTVEPRFSGPLCSKGLLDKWKYQMTEIASPHPLFSCTHAHFSSVCWVSNIVWGPDSEYQQLYHLHVARHLASIKKLVYSYNNYKLSLLECLQRLFRLERNFAQSARIFAMWLCTCAVGKTHPILCDLGTLHMRSRQPYPFFQLAAHAG